MPLDIVLPNLSDWAKNNITALYQAKTDADFNSRFESFFARCVNITVNGTHLSRDQYKEQLKSQALPQGSMRIQSSKVQISGAVATSDNEVNAAVAGRVGLFYTAVIDARFIAESVTNTYTSSLNLTVEYDRNVPSGPPPSTHDRGDYDNRRVTTLNQIFSDQTQDTAEPIGPIFPPHFKGVANVELDHGPVKLPPTTSSSSSTSTSDSNVSAVHLGPHQQSPFGSPFGPGPVKLNNGALQNTNIATAKAGEQLPGHGEFGPGPVIQSSSDAAQPTTSDAQQETTRSPFGPGPVKLNGGAADSNRNIAKADGQLPGDGKFGPGPVVQKSSFADPTSSGSGEPRSPFGAPFGPGPVQLPSDDKA